MAARNYERGFELAPAGHISKAELDKLEGAKLESDAAVASAAATVESAQLNLDFTKVMAPISGRIGRSKFSIGDLVGPNSSMLTTLVSIDAMEVSFQISEAGYWGFVRQRTAENSTDREPPTIKLELPNHDIYEHHGEFKSASNRVDPETGTLEVRASIPNPDGLLKPGQYVQVIVEANTETPALMVPQAAIQADQQGNFVMLLLPGNRVDRAPVRLGERVDVDVIVEHGLQAGDKVVVRGLQRIRPGQVVNAVELQPTPGS